MKSSKVIIVDYGMGNLFSIQKALHYVGADSIISDSHSDIAKADRLILPGVGAFPKAMEILQKKGLINSILEFNRCERPFLGICLGMQLLMTESEEFGHSRGLNLIEGKVIQLEREGKNNSDLKIPHIGWNKISRASSFELTQNIFLKDIPDKSFVYFIHSYIVVPSHPHKIMAETSYGDNTFCALLTQNHILGCQFHPERSGSIGLKMFKNFMNC